MKFNILAPALAVGALLVAGSAAAQTVLPPAQQGTPYTGALTGGSSYAAMGSLPPGLLISGSNLTGIPTVPGPYVFSVMATTFMPMPCPPPAIGMCPMPMPLPQTYSLQVAAAAAPAAVPTMTEWAMILLGVLLAGGAALTIQRRRLTA